MKENELKNIKNSKSSIPIKSINEENNDIEDEYLNELNFDEDYFNEEIEKEKIEYEELINNAKRYSSNLDEEIEYIIKHAKKDIYIVKALGDIINDEVRKNKKISLNLINDYLDLLKDNDLKRKKLIQLKNYDYKYKEIFLLKIAEIEIDNIENPKDENKIDYILSILEQAELLSKNNGTKMYLIYIYKEFNRLYSIDSYIKNEEKSKEYLKNIEKINSDIKENRHRRVESINQPPKRENVENINERKFEVKKNKNKTLPIIVAIVVVLIFINIGMYVVNSSNSLGDIQNNINEQNQQTQQMRNNSNDESYSDEENDNDEEPDEVNNEENDSNKAEKMSSTPTVKKSLPTRTSEYGDYDSYTQEYFMEMENLLTEYYTDYEKAVANSNYSYVRGDLVDDGQLSKELKISIPQYKNRHVYVKHFSIYNFDMYGDDEASFNLDTVFVVDGKKIQIETQRMTTYYDYYNQRWLIDNYTDWDIIYKQDYDPDVDYFDFTNYRDYF